MPGHVYTIAREARLSWWERLYLPEIVRGLWITGRHLVQNIVHMNRRITIEYPDQRPVLPQGYRAEHRLMLRPDESVRCTSCMLCATACPADCIEIVAEDVGDNKVEKRPRIFNINMLRCVFCGLCVEACPCDAIRMDTGKFENSAYTRKEFIYDIGKLMSNHPANVSPYSVALY
ncbi:MAG: NADH-quinone oxidoreductase subunit I [Deltaproteobacteria bacterium]|nr:NADH-quinone oxidoreductase subunit I [Deltaproteobacteria bacterium]